MLNTDRVNVLNTAVPDLVKHLPHMESGLVGLMSELRVLVAHDFDEDLSHLSDDVERLFNGLSEIRDLRAMGVKDENLLRAQGDLTDVLHAIRTEVLGIIHTRTAKLRVHAEMAARCTDVDLSPVDITNDYLVLASAPADPIFEERGQILQEFPVADKGGAAGRVSGHFLMLPIDDPERVRDNATPLDTFFLPEGRSLSLRKGDQVILRTQGYAVGDVPFGVSDFKAQHKDVFLEAEDAGIIISGPATLSPCNKISLKTHKENLSLIRSKVGALRKIDIRYLKGCIQKPELEMILVGPPTLAFGIFSSYLGEPETLPFSIILCGVGGMLTLHWVVKNYITLPKIKKRIEKMKSALQNLMNFKETEILVEESAVPNDHNHIYEPENVLKHLESIQSGDTLKFYAARKGIVREGQGVRIIEPLVALDAPTSMDLNASVLNTQKIKV